MGSTTYGGLLSPPYTRALRLFTLKIGCESRRCWGYWKRTRLPGPGHLQSPWKWRPGSRSPPSCVHSRVPTKPLRISDFVPRSNSGFLATKKRTMVGNFHLVLPLEHGGRYLTDLYQTMTHGEHQRL
jgi:hypothetical protein